MKRNLTLTLLATCGMLVSTGFAQEPNEKGPPPRPDRREGPPPSVLLVVFDTDKDGTISASEMKDAEKSLAKLDANADGTLTKEELRPEGGPRRKGKEGKPKKKPENP